MIRRASVWPVTLAAMAFCLLASPDLTAGTHVNKETGYKIKLPKDFEHTDNGGSMFGGGWFFQRDHYIQDVFECSKDLPTKAGWTYKRQMITFYFPERSAADIARAREEREKKSKEEGKGSIDLSGGRIYQSFEEYASDRITGFFFEDEKKSKMGGFPATIYQMKFEKLQNVPQRWMACGLRIPGGEFAVMFSCTEQHFSKFKGEHASTFKSFKMLDSAGLKSPDFDNSIDIEYDDDDVDEDKLSAQELIARREKQKEKAFKECLDELGRGWKNFETKHFLIAYQCPPKYAKQVSKQAEGVFKWLEEKFPGVGSGYVQSMIIKVYESEEAIPREGGFIIVSGSMRGRVREISFGRPTQRSMTSEFDSLNQNVMSNWFGQKNDELWKRMPRWLSAGLYEYIEDAEVKGSKLVFGKDEWEKEWMLDAQLAQKKFEGSNPSQAPLKPVKILLTRPSDELWGGQNGRFTSTQCASLVRYLLEGPGTKNAKTRSILPHYIGNLYELVEEVEAKLEKERNAKVARNEQSARMSDEEKLKAEDEEYRQRRENAYGKVAEQLLNKAFKATFDDWSDKDWATLDRSWNKYAAGRTK